MEFFGVIIHWFVRGGMVMYLLLLCSIISVAIIIERYRYFKAKSVNGKLFRQDLAERMSKESIGELLTVYSQKNSAAAAMVAAGFRAINKGRNPEAAMESAAQLESAQLKKGLSLLSVTVTMSPILGLLGTVVGMIQSFSVFNLEQGAPAAITGGVGEALIATATGLAVAIIALIGHSYYDHRLDGMMTSLEQIAAEMLENLPQDEQYKEAYV